MSSPVSLPYKSHINSQPNPNFGTGIFRRRIRLQGEPGKVIAELEDCNHGFRAIIHHDGIKVTAIEPEALRVPLTTCSGAVTPIQALVGMTLTTDSRSIAKLISPRANCTHLYDLCVLAIHHCLRGNTTRVWDITVPDEKDSPTHITAHLNGELVLSWNVAEWVIQDQGALHGLSLGPGFGKWASNHYQGDQLEAAYMLQKGYLVSCGRRIDLDKLERPSLSEKADMIGACYTYSHGVIEQALYTPNNTRDFTDTAEQLLTFKK